MHAYGCSRQGPVVERGFTEPIACRTGRLGYPGECSECGGTVWRMVPDEQAARWWPDLWQQANAKLAEDVAEIERERERDRLVRLERARADPSTPQGARVARQEFVRVLKLGGKHTHAEIAELTGVTVGTIREDVRTLRDAGRLAPFQRPAPRPRPRAPVVQLAAVRAKRKGT